MSDSTVIGLHHEEEHHPELLHHFSDPQQQKDSANLGMWIFLATEVMFFGGLFCAYLIYRGWYFEDFAAASTSIDALLGGTNTAVLICSSLTVVLAIWAAQTSRRGLLLTMLVLTMMFGVVFLGIKAKEYKDNSKSTTCPARRSALIKKPFPDTPVNTRIRGTLKFSSPSTSS